MGFIKGTIHTETNSSRSLCPSDEVALINKYRICSISLNCNNKLKKVWLKIDTNYNKMITASYLVDSTGIISKGTYIVPISPQYPVSIKSNTRITG